MRKAGSALAGLAAAVFGPIVVCLFLAALTVGIIFCNARTSR